MSKSVELEFDQAGRVLCCDPDVRAEAGRHAAQCTSPFGFLDDREVALTVACPKPKGCGEPAGRSCVTPQGYRTSVHRVRALVARGGAPAPVRAGGRPSHKQADMLAEAIANDGVCVLTNWNIHGVMPFVQAMRAMLNKEWFVLLEERRDENLYRITDAGRQAHARYAAWFKGNRS